MLALAGWTAAPAFAQMASPEEAAKRLGMSQNAIERVKQGEVVAEDLEASSDKDISLAVIARVDADLKTVYEFVAGDRLAQISTVTLSEGSIDPANPSLAAMKLDDETVARLAEDPKGTFFMSDEEAKRVAAAGKQGNAQALAAYRQVLAERAKAYWEKGLAGITPYGGEGRSPKVDLGHANDAAKKLVRNPVVRAELDAVPAKSSGKAEHRLSWAIQKGRDQAAPILIHHILYREEDGEVFVQRRFYSAYDYDSLQIVTGVLPTKSGASAVFYTNHTYTDQVAGFGGSAKRSIGRKMMQSELVAELQRAQKAVPGD
jgi:transcriptional regulator with XRE-family HTH domain